MAGWIGICGRRVADNKQIAYIGSMARRAPETNIVQVEGPLDAGKPGKAKYRTVERGGTRLRLRVVDADSANFAADFQASFAANVRRARAENRALEED